MFCRSCGQALPESIEFCTKCGTKQVADNVTPQQTATPVSSVAPTFSPLELPAATMYPSSTQQVPYSIPVKKKKPFYKRVWVWILAVVVLYAIFALILSIGKDDSDYRRYSGVIVGESHEDTDD